MSKIKPYTLDERALARRMFKVASANGTLKPRPGIGAVGLSNGRIWSASRPVTETDYLPDARKMLTGRPSGKTSRRVVGKKPSRLLE